MIRKSCSKCGQEVLHPYQNHDPELCDRCDYEEWSEVDRSKGHGSDGLGELLAFALGLLALIFIVAIVYGIFFKK